jgi:hypothetical protein
LEKAPVTTTTVIIDLASLGNTKIRLPSKSHPSKARKVKRLSLLLAFLSQNASNLANVNSNLKTPKVYLEKAPITTRTVIIDLASLGNTKIRLPSKSHPSKPRKVKQLSLLPAFLPPKCIKLGQCKLYFRAPKVYL